jgi:trehalose-6-phosphatase
MKILDLLSRDKKNTVFVLSPHSKRIVHQWFSGEAKSVGLASDDGYHYRFNSHFKSEYEWQRLVEIGANQTKWMSNVHSLMEKYVENTDGARIEKKEMSIVFDFSDAEP